MAKTIFYSWQSETCTSVTRNFIERSLELAIASLSSDTEMVEALRDDIQLDKDTKGLPGSPPIAMSIFEKINSASAFVADLTIGGKSIFDDKNRLYPNPNVLIEYGYATKSLGHDSIIGVMNSAFGAPTPESLPFNLRHLRAPITYFLDGSEDEDHRKMVRKELAKALCSALKPVIASEGSRRSDAAPVFLSFSKTSEVFSISVAAVTRPESGLPSRRARQVIEKLLAKREGDEGKWTSGRREIETKRKWDQRDAPPTVEEYDHYFTNHLRELLPKIEKVQAENDQMWYREEAASKVNIYLHNIGTEYLEDCTIRLKVDAGPNFFHLPIKKDYFSFSYAESNWSFDDGAREASSEPGIFKHHNPEAISPVPFRCSGERGSTVRISARVDARNLPEPVTQELSVELT